MSVGDESVIAVSSACSWLKICDWSSAMRSGSSERLNKIGERGSPWRTPDGVGNEGERRLLMMSDAMELV